MRAVVVFLLVVLCVSCNGQRLVKEEVDVLKKIGTKLRKHWDFTVDPCSNSKGWVDPPVTTFVVSNLTCHCATGTCHVISIQLIGQNLTGELPAEFASLSQLTFLDLTFNYLNGTIPVAWASLPLTNLSLLGNRISGRIPDEIGSITTLLSLVLEDNQLEGPIPVTLGKLTKLERLFLSGNNLSGELPDSLGNLKNMSAFLINGNPISGKLPSFIGNWTKLQRLDMLGTSLSGPFPPTFANLITITQLRISDWQGGDGKFPPLQNMEGMEYLVLRNLSISGRIPDYIGKMSRLYLLDLSFNKLSGEIPDKFYGLRSINYMYLTNNMLQLRIPDWIQSSSRNMDLSYNNFTGSPEPPCQQGNVNFFSSYSSTDSNLIPACLRRSFPCTGKPKNHDLFINCGGRTVTIDGNEYEGDASSQGAARYAISDSNKWAVSSTGTFLDNDRASNYIAANSSVLTMPNQELYMTARISPLSLRYYGHCLEKGNYTVNLHFAEIIFTDDQTFSSNGKRLFDVSIQGQKVLHDFNIAEEAKGTSKAIIKTFTTAVEDSLEIDLHWVGKGTVAIPWRSVYGPLISAISVTPNFKVDNGENKLSAKTIVGIVAAVCALTLLCAAITWFICSRRKYSNGSELRGLALKTSHFNLKRIKSATRNFNPANMIGEGGFGPVYKGVLPNGTIIAVKKLSSKSRQGNREFVTEVGMISALQHPNLVKLYGCCVEGNQLLLIYEYMENNSLARALFGPESSRLTLNWQTRSNICLGIAKGLTYLHEESSLKIIHRDIKATNILLDKDLNAKISDFGLAKLDENVNTHISTRIAGTMGYMSPEYAMKGCLTDKADVYSFGIVVLETVSGKSNAKYRPKEEPLYLLDCATILEKEGRLLELVDPNLDYNHSASEALQMLKLALLCANTDPSMRPAMSTVVSILEGKESLPLHEDLGAKTLEDFSYESQGTSVSAQGVQTESSSSVRSRIEEVVLSKNRIISDNSETIS